MDESAAQRNASQLDELVEDTSALSASLKRRIKALERQGGSGRDGQIRKQQARTHFFIHFTCELTVGIDRRCQVQVRGSDSKLSDGGATISNEV